MSKKMKPVLVTTKHRGVFAGLVPVSADLSETTLALKSARMVIRWRNTNGLFGLAKNGPGNDCTISAEADVPVLHDITSVADITAEAWSKFEAA